MFMEINGTIKVINNEIMLIIAQDDFKKFQEYENISSSKKFYAGFSLGNKQLYITGLFEKEKKNQGDNIVIMPISSANKQGNGKAFTTATEIKTLLGLDNTKKEVEVQMLQHPQKQLEELKPKIQELEAAKKKAEEELRTKTQELQDQLDTAQQEKQDLEAEVEKLKAIDSTALQQQLEEKNAKITELEALDAVALQQKLTEKENEITALKAQQNTQEVADLQQQLQAKDEEITALKAQQNTQEVANLQQQLQAKDDEITALKAQQNTQEVTDLKQQLADKEKEIAQLKQQQPNAEVDKLKADLTAKEKEVDKLKKENKELEAENKKIQQLKQGNGARYTATVGMGLAAGLIAFTALERTVKLEMLVMIGIAVASALVAGGITYAVLPSTQVDGAKAQEVNENGKKK
ncbi:hypothetical protein INQ25_01680 [Wolbachia endosymbiont of Rhagoletis cerasi]|uniref:hypothetical protein n=1 Tax=Wolbachia endosymbiont of Rhagoletis cerasi TaxID=225363 RepID=UPI001BD2B21F|nr:hypothetical protein [Wolbachia endosymbiont of Rhagoletis cerasi]MBS9530115.1 hypothetical protein [Wolbachia endosymbiont of Rhagoletis cerasi]